ncbi:MAG: hypothetical protein LAO55_08860 [Acidobacteriia bacterium]|nr:hypothetical protein [Terriglobia bacterium]
MPFRYERDDVHHRIVITFEGAFQMSEALASIERCGAENTWSQAVLYDVRHLVGQPDMDELRQLLHADLSIPTGGQARGPLAVVASAPSLYTKACTFAALAQPKLKIRVFRDLSEADSWLSAHTNHRSSLQGTVR